MSTDLKPSLTLLEWRECCGAAYDVGAPCWHTKTARPPPLDTLITTIEQALVEQTNPVKHNTLVRLQRVATLAKREPNHPTWSEAAVLRYADQELPLLLPSTLTTK